MTPSEIHEQFTTRGRREWRRARKVMAWLPMPLHVVTGRNILALTQPAKSNIEHLQS